MSERSDDDLINDMFMCLARIKEYVRGLSYEDFVSDLKTQDAVVRNIEILGEASKKLSDGFKKRHDHIPWKMIAGTRDRLIHAYFGVNIDVVWEIATLDAPSLKQGLAAIKRT